MTARMFALKTLLVAALVGMIGCRLIVNTAVVGAAVVVGAAGIAGYTVYKGGELVYKGGKAVGEFVHKGGKAAVSGVATGRRIAEDRAMLVSWSVPACVGDTPAGLRSGT